MQPDRLRLATPLAFDPDGAPMAASRETLRVVARVLRDRPTLTLEIASHWDSEGTDRENLERTQARAEAVRRVLIATFGIAPQRLRARGYGEAYPIDSNTTTEGRAANRRVELRRTDGTGAR